jgi:hypothetical protein
MSWLSLRPDIKDPHFNQTWRGNGGAIYGLVEFGGGADLVFSSPEDARAAGAACTEAAEAMERLAAEGSAAPAGKDAGDGGS